jgi:predicted nuclease of predicted toxin-antitoxin system
LPAVKALRAVGHDVSAVAELRPRADDEFVLALAHSAERVLLTEDKDFGKLAYADGKKTSGVVLIRFPASARRTLGQAIVDVVTELGERMIGAFIVVEPGRARISRPEIPE